MTLIICKTHGASSFFESCKHVENFIEQCRTNQIFEVNLYCYHMKICEHCINEYSLAKYVANENPYKGCVLEPDDFLIGFENAYESMNNKKGWCSMCYQEKLKEYE